MKTDLLFFTGCGIIKRLSRRRKLHENVPSPLETAENADAGGASRAVRVRGGGGGEGRAGTRSIRNNMIFLIL